MGAGAASNMNNVSEHNRISIGKTQNKVKRSTSLYTTLTVFRKATVLILVAFLPTPIGSVSRIRPAVPVPYRIDGCRRDRRGSPRRDGGRRRGRGRRGGRKKVGEGDGGGAGYVGVAVGASGAFVVGSSGARLSKFVDEQNSRVGSG